MPEKCHALLKDYANAFDMTMSEVMYESMRCFVHKHSDCCGYISALFTFRKIVADKRLTKECYGHGCFACKHLVACKTGIYQGNWEMSPKVKEYINLHT